MTTLGSPLLQTCFVLMPASLCALFLAALLRLTTRGTLALVTLRKSALGLLAWLVFWGIVGASGVLNSWDSTPPPIVLGIPLMFGATLALGFSPLGRVLAEHSSYAALIGIQSFRLPLELLLYRASLEGVMPEQMCFAGYNFDVLTGVSALVVLAYSRGKAVPRWLAWAFNLLGSGLLLVILTIAIVSMPMFALFGPDRTNTWVTHFPYVYLPAIMVQLALLAHVLTFRKLVSERAHHRVDELRPLGS